MFENAKSGLSFQLRPEERVPFFLVSALPIFLVLAHVALIALELGYDVPYHNFDSTPDPQSVRRAYGFLDAAQESGKYVALALLVAAGIGIPSRAVGSWAAIATLFGVTAALALWFYSAAPFLLVDDNDQDFVLDLHLRLASSAATTIGLLSAGYAVLAYRGLSGGDL